MVKLRLLSHRLQHLRCDALATSANAGLVGNANPNFWRFAGRKSADGDEMWNDGDGSSWS